jgi:hypothetical protein
MNVIPFPVAAVRQRPLARLEDAATQLVEKGWASRWTWEHTDEGHGFLTLYGAPPAEETPIFHVLPMDRPGLFQIFDRDLELMGVVNLADACWAGLAAGNE